MCVCVPSKAVPLKRGMLLGLFFLSFFFFVVVVVCHKSKRKKEKHEKKGKEEFSALCPQTRGSLELLSCGTNTKEEKSTVG